MNTHGAQAAALIQAGQRDELAFDLLCESGKAPLEIIGFHAQQACEKFIKAVLVIHGIVFGRTHDLVALAGLSFAHGIQVPIDKNTLRVLSCFAVQFRYESCRISVVNQADMAVMIATLKSWAEQEILDCINQ